MASLSDTAQSAELGFNATTTSLATDTTTGSVGHHHSMTEDHMIHHSAPVLADLAPGETDLSMELTNVTAEGDLLVSGHKHSDVAGQRLKDSFEDQGHMNPDASYDMPNVSEAFTHVYDTRFDGVRTMSDMTGAGCVVTKPVAPIFGKEAVAAVSPGEQTSAWHPSMTAPSKEDLTVQWKWRHGQWMQTAEM